uniref:Odorant receptor n=1 Tax=Takifugu rubripes TaxID=31033 RepID=Q2PR37_TAKRU|nr:odorant receptor [Takifugu rubripes]|eukprot:XP_003962131.1 PREDICTED: putative gustatory receptor clone PTE01 [Takifugu rubripes]
MSDNTSVVNMFTLSGLGGITNYKITLFVFTFLYYCVILQVNLTVILTIIVDKSLHEPMYIFLCNLCINGLYGTTGFYPKFLIDILSTSHVISYVGCLLQAFVLHSSACADFSILVLMAYDRYVAICRPLAYHSVMNPQRVYLLIFITWLIPFCSLFFNTITTSRYRLCGSHIQRIYCVTYMIAKLSCSASIANAVLAYINYIFYFCHFSAVVWSYVYLIQKCLGSKESRTKFMQTCLPHLLCLLTMVICMLFDLLYMRFGTKNLPESIQNFIAIQFILIPPILNPLIYGFKLQKIRRRIQYFLWTKHVCI